MFVKGYKHGRGNWTIVNDDKTAFMRKKLAIIRGDVDRGICNGTA